jgi:ketopantoate hydroxymethyltransferase
VKDFMAEAGGIQAAFEAYANAVRQSTFPTAEHSYE